MKKRVPWPMHSRSTRWDQQSAFITHPPLHHFFQTLATLNLHSNRMGAEGARSLADALKVNGVRSTICFQHTSSSPSLPLDTHHSEPWQQSYGCWRSEITGRCAQGQRGEINNLLSTHILLSVTSSRHSSLWTLAAIVWVMTERKHWPMRSRSTRWDQAFAFITQSRLHHCL